MATKNNPGAFDCYQKAEPDEPLFVLLARDKHAPALVWLWCMLRELDEERPEVVAEAQNCALSMVKWAHDHDRKSVGVGQVALAAVMELVRAANANVKVGEEALNKLTDLDYARLVMAHTPFGPPPPVSEAGAQGGEG